MSEDHSKFNFIEGQLLGGKEKYSIQLNVDQYTFFVDKMRHN